MYNVHTYICTMYILGSLLILYGSNWNLNYVKSGTEDYTGLEAISAGWGDYRLVLKNEFLQSFKTKC